MFTLAPSWPVLLFGGRADAGRVRPGADRALVEGRLSLDVESPAVARAIDAGAELDDGALLLSRAVGSDGRSRAHVGGRNVPVGVLTEIGEHVLALHGQSDQQRLLKPAEQRAALDRYAGAEVLELRDRPQWRVVRGGSKRYVEALTAPSFGPASGFVALAILICCSPITRPTQRARRTRIMSVTGMCSVMQITVPMPASRMTGTLASLTRENLSANRPLSADQQRDRVLRQQVRECDLAGIGPAGEHVVELLQQLFARETRRVGPGQTGEQPPLVPLVVQQDFLVGL